MGFKLNANQQIRLNDRMNNLTERERKIFDKTWAKPFAEHVFPQINEAKFEVLYCNDNGRPNTPVNVVIGSLLLKEMTQLTDEELLESIVFDPRYQYALNLTSYDEIPFSDRTVSRFRARLYQYEMDTGEDLLKEEIERLSGEFAKLLKINGTLKRMDSVMISSSCKNMGRLELMYTCVLNMVKALEKSGEIDKLPEHLQEYAKDVNINSICYRLSKDEVQSRLVSVTADALMLYELSAYMQGGSDEFQILERMLGDQTQNGELKANKEINPRSLQNPSDEDATFRRKSGEGYQGYVGNVIEDCGENGNIITAYGYEVNLHSDTEFAKEVIEELGEQAEPTVIITDGAYASEDNFKAAQDNNIELVTTTLTGQIPPETVLEFKIEDDIIVSCPEGQTPNEAFYDEDKECHKASFDKEQCENCPRKDECPVKINKKTATVKLSTTMVNRAEYIEKLSTEKYKDYAAKRNGVEGIPSILRRRYGIDHMPVRGLVRSKMWFGFKIGAINIKRVIAATKNMQLFSFFYAFSKSCNHLFLFFAFQARFLLFSLVSQIGF
jgi:hypothetical protein